MTLDAGTTTNDLALEAALSPKQGKVKRQKEGAVKFGWALVTSWDPVTSSAGWDVHALSLVYSGLTKLGPKGEAEPALAESWKYDSGGTAVSFTLRKGLRFSDGKPLTAREVKKSIERGRDDKKSLIASQLVGVKKVSAPDEHTVTIELAAPDFQIPTLLAGKTGMVVNPAVFERDAGSLRECRQRSLGVLRRHPDLGLVG